MFSFILAAVIWIFWLTCAFVLLYLFVDKLLPVLERKVPDFDKRTIYTAAGIILYAIILTLVFICINVLVFS